MHADAASDGCLLPARPRAHVPRGGRPYGRYARRLVGRRFGPACRLGHDRQALRPLRRALRRGVRMPPDGMARRTGFGPAGAVERRQRRRRGVPHREIPLRRRLSSRRNRASPLRALRAHRHVRSGLRPPQGRRFPCFARGRHARHARPLRHGCAHRASGVADRLRAGRRAGRRLPLLRRSDGRRREKPEIALRTPRAGAAFAPPCGVELPPRPLAASCGRGAGNGARPVERRALRRPASAGADARRRRTEGRHGDAQQGPVEPPVFRRL